MCGIAGIVKFNGGVQLEQLKVMTDTIIHRGPDGEGHWMNEGETVGFGHRRLAIIDLSESGCQPMHYQSRYTITYNGEIYNYLEIKAELEAEGVAFSSESDTEVLLALYAKKGVECLQDLDGMFAFSIWDNEKEELFCARDRFGEKPFYYYADDNQFVFASEMKEIWAYGIEKKIRPKRLNNFLESSSITNNNDLTETFYENIYSLENRHCFVLHKNESVIKQEIYWDIDLTKVGSFKGTFEEAKETIYSLFEDSVRKRLRSDVAVGSSLSGGIDSSAIVLSINKFRKESQIQKTFSARFKNFKKDEGRFIEKALSKGENIKSFSTYPDEIGLEKELEKLIYHQEEPFGSGSIYAQYCVMQLAKKNGVTVMQDGQGADEILGGYLPYYISYLNDLFCSDSKRYKKELKLYNQLRNDAPLEPFEKTETLRMKLGRYKSLLLHKDLPNGTSSFRKELYRHTLGGPLQELLRFADRNAMAHSIETRLPFLSHLLIEFVFTLPDEYLLKGGWTKYILRDALVDLLPKELTWRIDKIGYAAPQEKWLEGNWVVDRVNNVKKQLNLDVNSENVINNKDWEMLLYSYLKD